MNNTSSSLISRLVLPEAPSVTNMMILYPVALVSWLLMVFSPLVSAAEQRTFTDHERVPKHEGSEKLGARGWPASDDVAVLAKMLSSPRDAAEDYLRHPLEAALAATPNLVALNREDEEDAFDFVTLESLDSANGLLALFREPAAVEASYNIGLCSTPEDQDACLEEMKKTPFPDMLTVLYTKNALCVEVSTMASVYFYNTYHTVPTSMDYTLGSDAKHDNPNEHYHLGSGQRSHQSRSACRESWRKNRKGVPLW